MPDADTSGWTELLAQCEKLMASAPAALRLEITSVRDAFKYADPVSAPLLENVETEIKSLFNDLKQAVEQNSDQVPTLCNQLVAKIRERGTQALLLKK